MKADVLLGLQWGDEGKGKVVDVLTPKYDVIARFQGGPNAGHSLEFGNIKHVLHIIPSGVFHPDKVNIIGNGVVIDPITFAKEIVGLKKLMVNPEKSILVSKKAHLILPTHRILDKAQEFAKGDAKIGSTQRGIGPVYTDKTARNGIRVGDILSPNFADKYRSLTKLHIESISHITGFQFDLKEFEAGWFEGIEVLKQFTLIDSEYEINNYLSQKKSVLAEGAQGTLLDVDFGSYPFVTSSNTICAGACTGLGIAPSKIGKVFGIVKAYCTRVGSGPFPTELFDATGEDLRKKGNEFGSTTGRPRRCGWLDLPALKYSIMINGVTDIFLTKSDVLSGFETIKVCTAYKINGQLSDRMPFETSCSIEPIYTEMPGWNDDITKIKDFNSLPTALKNYIAFIEKETGVPVTIVSVGPNRDETIFR